MTDVVPNSPAAGAKFYDNLLHKTHLVGQNQEDYAELDQGVVGTRNRHRKVVDLLGAYIKKGVLLDYGCGTGLLLDSLIEMDCKPDYYIAVDFLPEREEHVMKRAKKYGVTTKFICGEILHTAFPADVALAIGIAGPPPFAGVFRVAGLVGHMRSTAPRGMITAPMPWREHYGTARQMFFDPLDIDAALKYTGNDDGVKRENHADHECLWHW